MRLFTLLCLIMTVSVLVIFAIAIMESRIGQHDLLPRISGRLGETETSAFSTGIEQKGTAIVDNISGSARLMKFSPLKINVLLGARNSKFAYITLIHGIDNTFSYRGFLYNALIMRKSLVDLGSTADFIVMLGFTTLGDTLDYRLFAEDIALLEKSGMRIFYLPRLRPIHRKVRFEEMALLKITPWNLTEYDRIQYFDGDVLPLKNMDCFFKYEQNTFNTGNASPLNSGWFLSVPNSEIHSTMRNHSLTRLANKWSENEGWGTAMPQGVFYRGGSKPVKAWNFNGASLDQGLLFHTYALHGTALLLDTSNGIKYSPGNAAETVELDSVYNGCGGQSPEQSFAHFTGRSKPWLKDLDKTKVTS
jgi:hypothetical protein